MDKIFPDPTNRGDIDFKLSIGGRNIVQITVELDGQIFSQTLSFLPNATKEDILKNIGGQFKVWARQLK